MTITDADGAVIGEDRINTAFAGGAARLVSTIRSQFGIRVDHYLQVNFAGFRDAVDAIDGVDVYLEGPVRDRDQRGRNVSGLDIDAEGCIRLDGAQTLAYVRSRHFEQLLDGTWHDDPTGDLGRIRRQHDLARRIAAQAIGRDLLDPSTILGLVDAARDNLVIDAGLSPAELVEFGQQLGSIKVADIANASLEVTDDRTALGAAILRLADTPQNASVLDTFRGVSSTTPRPVSSIASPTPSEPTSTTLPSC